MILSTLNSRQLSEIHARDFLGDDLWKDYKKDYDSLMSYRKTLKGKPTEEQMITIKMNAYWISYYDRILWHSSILANHKRCVCASCSQKRQKM